MMINIYGSCVAIDGHYVIKDSTDLAVGYGVNWPSEKLLAYYNGRCLIGDSWSEHIREGLIDILSTTCKLNNQS